jgi:polyhydroxyalkanoate synthesis repressor PhaR
VSEPYLIKKYSSRRLYDVSAGRFVTLAELFALIRGGRRIKAIDSQGRDITRSLLLQVLAEQEEGRDPPLLSAEVLHEMVRMYGDVMQALFARFLDQGLAGLIRQQQQLRSGMQEALQRSTAAAVSQVYEQQTALWKSGRRLIGGLLRGAKDAEPEPPPEPAASRPRARRR